MAFHRFNASFPGQGQETARLDRSEFFYQDIDGLRNKPLLVRKCFRFHLRSSAIVNSTGFTVVTPTFSLLHFLTNLSSHVMKTSALASANAT